MSQLVTISEAVKTTIAASFADFAENSAGEVVQAQVTRSWFAASMSARQIQAVDSRQVYVIPLGREFIERASRAEDRNGYRVGVLIVDKMPGEYESAEWSDGQRQFIDDAVAWVDELFDVLVDNDYSPVTGAMLTSGEITEAMRADVLTGYGRFWSEIELTFALNETN